MCRLRFHGGIVSSHQMRGVADIAADLGGGYVDVTTRANLQIREIGAVHGPEVLTRLYREQDQWRSTESFGRDDLLLLAKVANEAHSWIFQQGPEKDPAPAA